MSLTVGRLTPDLEITPTTTVDRGDQVTFAGVFITEVPEDARAFASMFPQLVNPDEPVVPVLYDEQPDLNGFYRVESATVNLAPDSIDHGHIEWSLSLSPVPGRGCPAVESVYDAVLRPNAASIAASTVNAWHAVPSSTLAYYDNAGAMLPADTIDTESGVVAWGQATTDPPYSRLITWRCLPEDWYNGAATIERAWDDDWWPLIGRDPMLTDSGNGWRITNGLVRFGIGPNDSDVFTLECFTGTTWESQTEVQFQYDNDPAGYFTVIGLTVIRNDPCEVRVRITAATGVAHGPPMMIDLRVRRGSPLVEMYWSQPGAGGILSRQWAVTFDPLPGSWTTVSAGRYNVADAEGNILVQYTPTGAATETSLTVWATAIGHLAPSGVPWTYATLRENFYGAAAELVRIVGS